MSNVTKEMLDEVNEREMWDRASFDSWWATYRAFHPSDGYPVDAPKEVRQAFIAALAMLREKQDNEGWLKRKLATFQQEEKMSAHDSHALMAAEIARLREQNKKLRAALAFLKDRIWAGSISPREFVTFVDKKLEELKED
jgi:hypothetical protein